MLKDSDSREVREGLMKDATTAIGGDKFVAVLGLQFVNTSSGPNSHNTAVFVYRPGGDKRLSMSTLKYRASSRYWRRIDKSYWKKFKQIVGIEGKAYSCKELKESLYV